jgi:leader peptidase (prepilin peptidase)/N-methyltransferase
MYFFFSFAIFILGLMVGSFLNCVVYRLEKEESFLKGRSYCPYCKHVLGWQDLIPLLSFVVLKRRCRYCGKSISWQYPLVELATGLIFVLVFNFQFPTFNIFTFLYYLIISSFLIVIFVYDLKHFVIPDAVIYPAIILSFLYCLLEVREIGNFQLLIGPLLSAFSASLFFGAIVLASKGKWMGSGDISLAFLMGLILGWPNILTALFPAFFIGAIIGTGLIMAGRKTLKSEIPFGPFLVIGTFLAMFFGEKIVNWYLNLYLL